MRKETRALKRKAEGLGISVDELVEEMEVGSPDKSFVITVAFDRYKDLRSFADEIAQRMGLAIYQADSLDHEYNGSVRDGMFVLRDPNGFHGKPDHWRVD
jgi:hypothetical protein